MEDKTIKMIAVDMDGTLLNDRKQLPADFLPLAEKLLARGIILVIASGRQYYNLLTYFGDFRDRFYFISDNGSLVYHQDKIVYSRTIPSADIFKITAAFEHNLPDSFPILCGAGSAYILSKENNPEFLLNARMYHQRLETIADFAEAVAQDSIGKIAVYDLKDAETGVYPFMLKHFPHLNIALSGQHWIDIMQKGVSKGSAINFLQQKLGITPNQTMAFGDYLNDCELLRHAHYSYAMAGAHPELKKISRFTAPSNNDNGVIKILKEYWPQ